MTINKLDGVHKLGLFATPSTLIIGLVVSLLLYFLLPDAKNWVWTKSFLLGLFTGLMNFGFFVKGTKKMEHDLINESGNGVKRSVIYFFMRILVFVCIFGLVAYDMLLNDNPSFNIYATAIGYFLHIVVLAIVYIVFYIKGEKVSIK